MTETSVVQQATALEHKFKTWLIRSTRMKFNIGIKEIVFTRYPILILILLPWDLPITTVALLLCSYTESRASYWSTDLSIYVSMLPGYVSQSRFNNKDATSEEDVVASIMDFKLFR